VAPNTETSNMSLLKKFSKSTQDLREKKKWKMSTFKPKRKRDLIISSPHNCQHIAGLDPDSGGVFTNSDVSVVPLARKADIMIMKNKSRDLNELDDMRIDLGKMNLLDDVLAVMDKHLETSNKHTDRNSLGNTTDYSDTESRGSSYLNDGWKTDCKSRRSSSKSVPSSPAHKRISHVIDFTLDFNPESPISLRNSQKKRSNDEISQKDSFYSTTDISQCETDREVQL